MKIESLELAARLHNKRVLIIGDVMLDQYLLGDTERISPEAPVPVIRLEDEQCYLGGAGNVARNILALGGKATLVAVAGDDQAGHALQDSLQREGIDAFVPCLPGRVTTTKTRVLARRQQMLRLDKELCNELEPEHEALLFGHLATLLENHDLIVLSDYGKGLVSSRFIDGLRRMLHELPRAPHVLVDPRPAHFPLYQGAFLLTPNVRECGEAVHLPCRTQDEIIRAGRAARSLADCKQLLVTLGANGMALFDSEDRVWHIPTSAQAVFDVSGAGDTVIATIALALAAGMPLLSACMLANFAAGLVVAQVGTGTTSTGQLAEVVKNWPVPELQKWA